MGVCSSLPSGNGQPTSTPVNQKLPSPRQDRGRAEQERAINVSFSKFQVTQSLLKPRGGDAVPSWRSSREEVSWICMSSANHTPGKVRGKLNKGLCFYLVFSFKKKYSGRGRILAIYCEAPLDQISANDSHLFPPFRNDLLYKLMSAYLNALSDSVLGAMAISDRDWGWTHQSCGSQCCHYVHW